MVKFKSNLMSSQNTLPKMSNLDYITNQISDISVAQILDFAYIFSE